MKNYLKHHPWHIIEEGFHPEFHQISESIFSLGNGRFGIRGNFEEDYSGESLRGSYFAGIYYPDKTRVGWWKNGYPEYFAKVLNSVNWIGIRCTIDGKPLDLAVMKPVNFQRILDMENGLLIRKFAIELNPGERLHFHFERFCNMGDPDTAAQRLLIRSEGYTGTILIEPYLDFDVHNEDANYGEQFWIRQGEFVEHDMCGVAAETKKTGFVVSSWMYCSVKLNGIQVGSGEIHKQHMKVVARYSMRLNNGDEGSVEKLVLNQSSLYVPGDKQQTSGISKLQKIKSSGYDVLKSQHIEKWRDIWEHADIEIEGDTPAQQGIRFNIFHLWQTYTGDDPRLNIGPKGFTGEKYGGSTYWDTEAYCIPFYLSTADPEVSRNLLVYRYLHLSKAIENAAKLGFTNGAALYPMVTINGEECHNEWEITFEEIHRNGAIVFAIFDYIRYTGDHQYISDKGIEVLIGVARFWKQRVNYSEDKQAWVMLGVTGPNEYENNVNNNWYTNYIARWCLQYAVEQINYLQEHHKERWQEIKDRTHFKDEEITSWNEVIAGMYFPYDNNKGIFLQQDGFLDKELMPASALPTSERPLNQRWSWDRILRSCFIKQADVLQGMYFFEDHFEQEVIKKHFEFYEPMTVHESSLSPCVHAILAVHLGLMDKANEMYLRTARLDLDDYNNDTADGLHITSMAGTWMSIVRGFAGLAVRDNKLHLAPVLPEGWSILRFRMLFRHRILKVTVQGTRVDVVRLKGEPMSIFIHGDAIDV